MRTGTPNTFSFAALLRQRSLDRRGWHRRLLQAQSEPAPYRRRPAATAR